MARPSRSMLTGLALGAAAVAAVAAPAPAAAALLPPSITTQTTYAPPSGVARHDFFTGTSHDRAEALAMGGERSYTVGSVAQPDGDTEIAIVARKRDGSLDSGFDGDGRKAFGFAPSKGVDLANGIVVLPDGRLRIVGAYDADPAAGVTNLDALVVGLNPDGSLDTGFGVGGWLAPGSTPDNEELFDIAVGPGGRLALAGRRASGGQNDTLLGLLEANGGVALGFGANLDGVRVIPRAAANLDDAASDVIFDGERIVALLTVERNADVNVDDAQLVLRAVKQDGSDDGSFGGSGDVPLDTGAADALAGGLIAHDGKYWVSGCSRPGGGLDRACASNETGVKDADAVLVRLNADGGGQEHRRFDLRGTLVPAGEAVLSEANDLVVVPGTPTTLAVVGSVGYSFGGDRRSDWAAAAFNGLGRPLGEMNMGEIALETPNRANKLTGVAPDGPNAFVVGGHLDAEPSGNSVTIDTSFGTARMLVDAEKRCNLAVRFTSPLELVFTNRIAAAVGIEVKHVGTRPCAGVVDVPAPFSATAGGQPLPVKTGMLTPGDTFVPADVQVSYNGPRPVQTASVRANLTIDGDVDDDPRDNTAAMLGRFAYCDTVLTRQSGGLEVPTQGRGRVEVELRNIGTVPCRDARLVMGGGFRMLSAFQPFVITPGRAGSSILPLAVPRGARPGRDVAYSLAALTSTEDLEPANNFLPLSARIVRVGDSDIRSLRKGVIKGISRAGGGSTVRRNNRVARVHVAIQKLDGKSCMFLTNDRGKLRRTGRSTKTCRPVWLKARGAAKWYLKLRLKGKRRSGRFVILSRATTRSGFPEARWTESDMNRRAVRKLR